MKKLIVVFLVCIAIKSYSQDSSHILYVQPTYPRTDTLHCHFLEVENDSTFTWKSGYVIRHNGFIDFVKTSVQEGYLPVTSGVVTSPLFYNDMMPIKNYAIQVVIKLTQQLHQ